MREIHLLLDSVIAPPLVLDCYIDLASLRVIEMQFEGFRLKDVSVANFMTLLEQWRVLRDSVPSSVRSMSADGRTHSTDERLLTYHAGDQPMQAARHT